MMSTCRRRRSVLKSARHQRPLQRRSRCCDGFTLLEVILALAILAGSIAVIGEAMRLGMRNGKLAREQCHAQFLCESKLAEVVTQSVPFQAVSGVPCETDPEWVYSTELEQIDAGGLLAVRVTVAPAIAQPDSRSEFTLVRWMRDPGIVMAEEALADEAAAAASGTSSGTTQSGSSGASGSGVSGFQSSGGTP